MKLTGDLFFEDNGSMIIIPKDTIIREWHDSPEPPNDYYADELNQDDSYVESILDNILSGEISIDGKLMSLTGFYDPQDNTAIIGDGQIYDGENVKSIEHAINWYNSNGMEIVKKYEMLTPVFGISGPDKDGDYYAVVADKNDIHVVNSAAAGTIGDTYDLYKSTALKIAKEKASSVSSEPDHEQTMQDRKDADHDRNMDDLSRRGL